MSLLLGGPHSLVLLGLVQGFLKLCLRLKLQLQLLSPLGSLVQRGVQLVPLLLQANVGSGCLELLAVVRLQKTTSYIKLRATILVTHSFGGYYHRERCSRTR